MFPPASVNAARSSVTSSSSPRTALGLAALVDSGSADVLVLRADNEVHKLDYEPGQDPPIDPTPGFFQHYIWNQDVGAKVYPQRADSYLLVSPGADGLYGTADDIANFDHGGR